MTYTEADVKAFAKHYDVPVEDARSCWKTGGNWAKAFDALVAMYRAEVVA
jgi:hypothetical protein